HMFTRDLKELTEPHVRREILDVLVDLAAADGEIALPEVNLLRQLTTALGLTQADYNASQARHRDKLATPSSS
ncbi:MAG: TerB family tellurite resistance protein, partial [Myxococcota bacterium]